jgi:hypothetical protein
MADKVHRTRNSVLVLSVDLDDPDAASTMNAALGKAGYMSSAVVSDLSFAKAALENRPRILICDLSVSRSRPQWIDACNDTVKAATPGTKIYTMTLADFPQGAAIPPTPDAMAAAVVACCKRAEAMTG